ncbi:MAG: hypothetical protein WC781_03380 [Candidatus Pacearchaeota archaeon]|jgi:hypothetical protein
MDVESVKKYIGKRCKIVLKNNYNYTATIPKFNGTSFEIIDKYGDMADVECDFIGMIQSTKGDENEKE